MWDHLQKKGPCEAPLVRGWLGKSGPCPQCLWGAGDILRGRKLKNHVQLRDLNLIKCNTILTFSSCHHPAAGTNGTFQYISRFPSETVLLPWTQTGGLVQPCPRRHQNQNRDGEPATRWSFFFPSSAAGRPSPSVTVSLPNAAVMCELVFGVLPHLPSPFRVLVTSRRRRLRLGVEINIVTPHAYLSALS